MLRRQKSVSAPRLGAMVSAVCASVTLVGCSTLPFGAREAAPTPVAAPSNEPAPPAWTPPAAAAVTPSDEAGRERLVRLAEVWHAVRWFHPEVAVNPAPWDTAYLRHVERARTTETDAEFADAVQAMLDELGDAETRVVRDTLETNRRGTNGASLQVTADGFVLARPVAVREGAAVAISPRVPRTVSVLDLRAPTAGADSLWWVRALDPSEYPLPDTVLSPPLRRTVRRAGPDGMQGETSMCCASWTLLSPPAIADAAVPDSLRAREGVVLLRSRNGERAPSLVVLVNDQSRVPAPLFALHAANHVRFVSTGTGVMRSDARASHVPLGGGFFARVRLESLLLATGTAVPVRADTVLAGGEVASRSSSPDSTDAAVSLALALVRGEVTVPTRMAPPSRLTTMPSAGATSSEVVPYPSLPERLLAVSALWGAVRAFNPYLPMADVSWDDTFTRALAEAEAAADARAFSALMLRMAATLDASQVEIEVAEHPEFGRRAGYVPFRMRLVERKALVASIDDSAAARSGVQVGDEVMAIGGEPIDKRFGRLRELVSASNAWSREHRLMDWLESGRASVKATFQVRTASGAVRDMEFAYGAPSASAAPRLTTVRRQVETMSGGVVRVRLGAASTPLPADVASAAALIVDARGLTTAESLEWLAGSVMDADARPYARDERSVLQAPSTVSLRTPELDPARATTRSERITPPAVSTPFSGPMAILVDAGTAGDGELLALRLLMGGSPRVLVGSPTAGSVGDAVRMALAGGVQVTFPVSEVRHADGRFIQRLGLTPSESAAPTVQGVRSGRDDVLEAAQRWIAQQLAPPAPVRRR